MGEERLLSAAGRRLWDAAVALNRAAAAVTPAAARLPPLLFLTDPERTPRPWETAARLPPGAAVVYRAFGAADAADVGRRLRAATRPAGVRLLVGLDPDLAEAIAADGVHLPERALDQAAALRRARPGLLLTGAVHGARAPEILAALDAVVISPVFPAGGASGSRPALGVEAFAALARAAGRPAYALGGVDADTAARITGACGLAAVSAITEAF